jgi:hypothetical protein
MAQHASTSIRGVGRVPVSRQLLLARTRAVARRLEVVPRCRAGTRFCGERKMLCTLHAIHRIRWCVPWLRTMVRAQLQERQWSKSEAVLLGERVQVVRRRVIGTSSRRWCGGVGRAFRGGICRNGASAAPSRPPTARASSAPVQRVGQSTPSQRATKLSSSGSSSTSAARRKPPWLDEVERGRARPRRESAGGGRQHRRSRKGSGSRLPAHPEPHGGHHRSTVRPRASSRRARRRRRAAAIKQLALTH